MDFENFDDITETRSDIFEVRLEEGKRYKDRGNEYYVKGDLFNAEYFYHLGLYHVNFDELQFNFELMDQHREALLEIRTPICLNLAYVRIKLHNYEKAVELCKAVLKEEADNVKAHYRVAMAYKSLGKTDEAYDSINAAYKLTPNDLKIRQLRTDIINERKKERAKIDQFWKGKLKKKTKVLTLKSFLSRDLECDISCMNADCGYDSSSSSMDSSDCLSLCSSFGCSEVLLDNDSCDPECDLPECGFDKGQCGYCWSGCFESDLLDSIQNSNCNNIYCYYDASLFKECSPGCTNQMLLNSDCDSECNTSLCNFDFGNCQGISWECSEGCLSSYLGNGICNEECNNQECSFDDYDCLCAPECTEDLLTNGICDEVCSKGTCEDDCACDSKCENSYGDGVCDEDCWNEMCEWIDKDCGCSPDCKLEEIADCKKECLVKDCNFGDMGENAKCEDSLKLELARAYQIINADFDLTTSIEDCQSVSLSLFGEACSEVMLANDPCYTLESGKQPCNIIECGFALGWCSTGCDCGDGSRCFEDNSSKCLSCSDKKQFFYKCVEECPLGFEADSSNLCMHLEDTSSEDSPKEYYVKNGLTDYGDGSEESPFSSVSIALARIYTKFSVIHLEENEHYTLSSVPDDLVFIGLDQKRPLSRPYFKPENLTIQGSSSFLEIQSQDFLTFDAFSGILEIRSLTFSAPNLSDKCEEDCDFCDEDCTEDCVPDCSEFDTYDFIYLSDSMVILSEIKFKDLRNNFRNLIYMDGGTAELRNVDFERVKIKASRTSALINGQGAEKIHYANGTVSYLNDGFKIDLLNFYHFNSLIIGEKVNYVIVEGIDFHYNILHSNPLIYMLESKHLEMNACGFYDNMLNSGIVYLEDVENPTFTLKKDSNNTIYEMSYDHVKITNIVLKNNFLYEQFLIRFRIFHTNFLFENIVVDHIFLEDGEGIDVENDSNIDPGYIKIYANGVRKLGYYSGISVAILNVTFKDWVLYEDYPLWVYRVREVYIDSLNIQNISSEDIDIFEFFLDDFLAHVSSTYQVQELDDPETIPATIKLQEVEKITIINSSFSDISLSGAYLIDLENSLELTIDNMTIDNIEIDLSTGIINIAEVKESSVRNSIFTNGKNKSLLGGGLFLLSDTSHEKATFENCTMISNAATYGGSIMSSQDQLFIRNCTFIENQSFSMNGGAVLFVTNSNNVSYLSVTNSTFIGNSATLADGGGIYISQEGSEHVEINIEDCEFRENFANNMGSGIGIHNGLIPSSDSCIQNCLFYNNSAGNGAIGISNDGHLLIDSCEFNSNRGNNAAAIYHEGAEDLELYVNSTSFLNNVGISTIHVGSYSIFNKMTTDRCKFEYNSGKPVVIQRANWTDFNSEFNHNTDNSEEGTGSEITYFAMSYLEGTTFYNNTAKQGSGLTVTMRSQAACNHCTFDTNVAFDSAGAINVKQSAVDINNSLLIRNSCISGRASAFKVSDSGDIQSTIRNTEITLNRAGALGYNIVSITSTLLLKGINYHDNTADNEETGILLNLSVLYMEDSQCYNQESLNAPCILGTMGELYVRNSTFYNNLSSKVSGAISIMKVTAEVKDSDFYNIETYDGGAINSSSDSYVTVDSCSFSQITTGLYGVVTGKDSTMHIKNSALSHYTGNGAYCQGCASFTVENSAFSYGTADFGAGLQIKTSSCEVSGSSFSYLSAYSKGGAVSSDSDEIKNLAISDSTFLNNTSHGGGAIYTMNNFLNISHSRFEANGAYEKDDNKGNGGGALLECTIECEHYIQNNVFIRNEASYEGGAVHWKDEKPLFESNVYQNNFALYGDDIASFPVELIEINTARRLNEDYPTIAYIEDVAPGQSVEQAMTLALRDHYGQIIKTDSESRVTLSSVNPEVQVTGTTFFIASHGLFNISDYTIEGTPNSTVKILLTTTAIDTSKPSDQAVYPEVYISAKLRSCAAGEVNIRNSCVKCAPNFYSLDANDLECRDCPTGAVCEGGNIIYPEPEYWRSSEYSDRFWPCPNPDACMGGNSTELMGRCSEGYKGNKCQSCAVEYSRSFTNKCASCPDQEWDIVKLVGIMIGMTLGTVLIIRSSLSAAFRPKSMYSVYLKIFLNYVQLVMMTTTFELDWPEYVIELFTYQERTGSATEHLFSFDCFISDKSSSDVYFMKIIFFTALPFCLILLSFIIWGIVALIKWNLKFLSEEMISTNIILIFIIHSGLMKKMFGVLNCKEINEGEQWLDEDLDILCWDEKHTFYAFILALPSIIIWGLFVPSAVLYILYRNKRRLRQLDVRKKYGFLFNGFSAHTYYWEIVILYRKIVILFCAVALKNISIPVQALCVMIVLLVSIYIQKKYNPYSIRKLNQIELRSILVGACTIYCGLFYLTGDLNYISKMILFVVIVSVNLYFLAVWFHGMCKIGIRLVGEKIPIFKKYFVHRKNSDMAKHYDGSHSRNFADKTFELRAENVVPIEKSEKESSFNARMKDLFLEVLKNDLNGTNEIRCPDMYNFTYSIGEDSNDDQDQY